MGPEDWSTSLSGLDRKALFVINVPRLKGTFRPWAFWAEELIAGFRA